MSGYNYEKISNDLLKEFIIDQNSTKLEDYYICRYDLIDDEILVTIKNQTSSDRVHIPLLEFIMFSCQNYFNKK